MSLFVSVVFIVVLSTCIVSALYIYFPVIHIRDQSYFDFWFPWNELTLLFTVSNKYYFERGCFGVRVKKLEPAVTEHNKLVLTKLARARVLSKVAGVRRMCACVARSPRASIVPRHVRTYVLQFFDNI